MKWANLVRLPDAADVEPGARIGDYLFAIPNGGARTPIEAKILKGEGVKPGVFDLQLPLARHGFHGLWIEMKADDGVVSEHQEAWRRRMDRAGYATRVCWSWDQARQAISAYVRLGREFADASFTG